MPNIGPMEIGLVLIVALIVFGPKKLPDLGRSLGKGIREFKGSVTGEDEPEVSRPAAIEPVGSDAEPTRAPEAGPAAKTPA
jgi:sec-independent protein translocase protein TatA